MLVVLTVTRPGRGCWNANYDLTMDREEGAPLIRLVTNVRKKKNIFFIPWWPFDRGLKTSCENIIDGNSEKISDNIPLLWNMRMTPGPPHFYIPGV